jgi:parvulin-like peptidyl-prolyl isomerase
MCGHPFVLSVLSVWLISGCSSNRSVLAGVEMPTLNTRSDEFATPVRLQKPDGDTSGQEVKPTVFDAVSHSFPAMQGAEVTFSIRAHVNGVPIFEDEVKEMCLPALMSLSPNLAEAERTAKQVQIYNEALDQIIDREVVLQDAFARLSRGGQQYLDKLTTAAAKEFDRTLRTMKTRAGVKSDDEFKALLRSQGQSLDGLRRQFERNFMFREYVRSRIFPQVERYTSHQEIVNYYNDHSSEFQAVDSVKWQDIFLDASRYRSREEARDFAQQLVTRARAGDSFDQLLKFDNGDSSYRNGEGFGQRRGEIKPVEAEAILFSLKDGDLGPVIEMPAGFHVIRLVKRQYAGLIPLDQKSQEEIRKKLQNVVAERESKRLVAELKQKATIEVEKNVP